MSTAAALPPQLPEDHGPVPNPLPKLLAGEDLTADESRHLFERLVLGRLEPAEIAGMLIALRMKGETPEEMIGAARGLFDAALIFPRPDYRFADCCGTGGDGAGSINISTASLKVMPLSATGCPSSNRTVTRSRFTGTSSRQKATPMIGSTMVTPVSRRSRSLASWVAPSMLESVE